MQIHTFTDLHKEVSKTLTNVTRHPYKKRIHIDKYCTYKGQREVCEYPPEY